MATSTTKLGLIKPDFVDVVDVSELNSNADDIDAAVGFAIVTSATRPGAPWTGQSIFETDTGSSFIWDGSVWQPGGGGGSIEISATAPSSPGAGDLWWDSDNGKLYIYYDDGTSQQWVDAAGPSVAVQSTAPTGYEGQLWLDDTDGSMYVYYTDPGGGSSSWIGAVSRSGGILQVVQTVKTDAFSSSTGSFVDVTGLSATITPRSTSSKILVLVSLVNGNTSASGSIRLNLVRGATNIAQGTGGVLQSTSQNYPNNANSGDSVNITFLDSPSTTSSTTYKIQTMPYAVGTVVIGRLGVADERSVSTITLIEVAG